MAVPSSNRIFYLANISPVKRKNSWGKIQMSHEEIIEKTEGRFEVGTEVHSSLTLKSNRCFINH